MKKISGHKKMSISEWFSILAQYSEDNNIDRDVYGTGKFLNEFESEMAKKFGMDKALFMPSGVMAQLMAIRIWSERKKNNRFSCHSTCHLTRHENNAYQELHGLSAVIYGKEHKVVSLSDIQTIGESISSVVIELPMRHLGGDLPEFEELKAISDYCRSKGIALHLDGARIFECIPFYQRPLSEIVALFDSAFLSFYKGIGSTSGSMLFGDTDFIDNAKIWLRRHGGNLFELFPLAVSAKYFFQKNECYFHEYFEKTKEFAEVISEFKSIHMIPSSPKTNMMHLLIPLSAAELAKKWDESPFGDLRMGNWGEIAPGVCRLEFVIGRASLEWSPQEFKDALNYLLE